MPSATTTTDTPTKAATSAEVKEKNAKYDVPYDDSKIVKYGEPGAEVLRRVADEIKMVDTGVRALVREMAELMYAARGVGLAAPQIGRSVRLLVYDAGDGLRALINPVILKSKGEQFDPEEGCLSIPGLRGVVRRAYDIQVKAIDENGRPLRFRATEFEARVIQHELDHLDGVLFIDRADPASLHMLSAEEQAEEHESAGGDGPTTGIPGIAPAE